MTDESAFQQVELHTSTGGMVARVTIPRFVVKPDVLVWGSRVFTLAEGLPGGMLTYQEAFAFWVPPSADASGRS